MAEPIVTEQYIGSLYVVEIVQTDASPGDIFEVEASPPISGTIVRMDVVKSSGPATLLVPGMFYQDPTGFANEDEVRIIGGLTGGPTSFGDSDRVTYARPGWDGKFWLRNEPDAGPGNVIRTRIHIEAR